MEDLKIGDVVKLKSGGPIMTIQWINEEDDSAKCSWFKGNEVGEKLFAIQSLKKTTEVLDKDVKNPDIYDEKGVPWKNRVKELERKLKK